MSVSVGFAAIQSLQHRCCKCATSAETVSDAQKPSTQKCTKMAERKSQTPLLACTQLMRIHTCIVHMEIQPQGHTCQSYPRSLPIQLISCCDLNILSGPSSGLQEGVQVKGGIGPICEPAWSQNSVGKSTLHQQLFRLALVLEHACPPFNLVGQHACRCAQSRLQVHKLIDHAIWSAGAGFAACSLTHASAAQVLQDKQAAL